MHNTPTARIFSLANFYLLGPFNFIFSKTSSEVFLCYLRLMKVPVWDCRIKQFILLIVTDD